MDPETRTETIVFEHSWYPKMQFKAKKKPLKVKFFVENICFSD